MWVFFPHDKNKNKNNRDNNNNKLVRWIERPSSCHEI
jgi:hypothetical protein